MKKQTRKAKRGLAMLLCASIVISVTPGPVMAEENFTSEEAWTENPQTEEVITFEDETTEENWITEEADTDELKEELFMENFESGNGENAQISGDTMTQLQAGAEENDSEIAVQANDSAGKTEQQSTEEEECKHEGIEITFNSNGFGNCPKCNATVYQPAVETTDKYDIDDDSTKDTVYEISNAGQLYWFAGLVNGTLDGVEQNTLANAILTANITVNENLLDSLQYDTEGNVSNGSDFISWTPIADCMEDHITLYSGTFDGNNKTVSGLYFNDNSTRIGLFGSSEADGNIKNVGVVDSYFKGNDFVGGVCGRNDGTITNCYNAGNLTVIESSATIGGICGYNSGTVTNCYNIGTVTATGQVASVGGVCGCSTAPISNCYNIGTVTATSSSTDISGICGYNFGPVTNCYYLADTEDENGGKTTAQFASGEVAYLLSQGYSTEEGDYDGSIWGQKLGENGDTYPVLKKAGDVENTVYRNETYPGCEGKPGDLVYSYSNTQKAPTYAEHTDEDLDGKCDVGGEDFKTYNQLGKLITKVKQNLSDEKYADVQYTTASIDALRKAIVVADTITEASSDTDVATAFDKLLAASTVGADGLIKADHNIVISFADAGAPRGIASGNGWYANGDTVTLKVTPSVGYIFGKWTKDTAGNTSVGTESTYTFTLGADSPDAYYAWLDEEKYTVTCESTEGGTCTTSTSDGKYVYGQKATVTATASDGYEFVGWKDIYGTTVSTDAVYNFTVIGDATLKPEFVKVKTDEGADIAYVTVSFYHQSGKLLDSQKVVSGEGKIITTVNAPTKVGFDFLGWSAKASGATAEDVVDFETATFSENTSLYPVFKAQDITYTLTVGLQTEQKAPQSSVTVTADPIEGKQFVGWKDANGNIVSYDSTYTFIITGDTTLTAYYEQADSEVVKEPTIIMGEPIISVKQQGVSKKATMYFNYDIPSGNELVDIGVVYVSGKQNTLDMNTPGVVIRSAMSTINASSNNVKNQFYYSKTMITDSEYTFIGYIVYTDSSGKRIIKYSNLKNASYND
ncbi:InlB B-repeat-containing protein [Mediterraneibacter sp. HCN-7094]